jgi:hypothetical protein
LEKALLDGTVVWVELGNRVFGLEARAFKRFTAEFLHGRVGRFGGIHRHSFRRFLRLTGMPRGATSVTSDIDFSPFVAVFLVGF